MFILCPEYSNVSWNERTKPRIPQTPTLNPSQPRHPRVLHAAEVTETTDALPSTPLTPHHQQYHGRTTKICMFNVRPTKSKV